MPYNDMGIDCSPTRALLVLPLVPPALKSLCYHHIGLDIFLPHIGPDIFLLPPSHPDHGHHISQDFVR